MHYIWRNRIGWEVIHAFIKSGMLGSLDSIRLGVVPDNILVSVGEETKEDTFSGVRSKLGLAASWRTNPHTATKSAEGRKIIAFACRNGTRGQFLVLGWQTVVDAKPVVECVGPELDG